MPTGEKMFTRQQIYEIRARADAGESAPSIARNFPRVAVETIRRIVRRETYREIGVGAGERPMVSNRLIGEARQLGDPVEAWHGQTDTAERARKELAEAEARVARAPAQAGPTPDDAAWAALQAQLTAQQDDPLAQLIARGREVRRETFDAPTGGPAGESPEELLARKAATLPAAPPTAEAMLRELTNRGDRDEG